ncbi:MAG: restriction endonuclease subunit S [Acidimicrobiia bacterium]
MTDLPTGWAATTLGDATETTRPICYGVLKPGPFVADGVPLVRIVDIADYRLVLDEAHRISHQLDEEFSRSRLQGGEVLLSIQGTVGRAAICPLEAAGANVSRTVAVIDPDRRFVKRYLLFYFWHLSCEGSYEAGGTTRASLNISTIREMVVPMPPVAEQERIVTAIEEAFSKLDAGEAALRNVRRLLKRMRESILTAAVTGRLVPQDSTDTPAAKLLADFGVEAAEPDGVPELPPSWSWAELGVIADVVGGVTKDSKRQSDPSFVEVPYLRVANVQRGFLDLETITTIRVAPEKAGQLQLQPGDVLFNEGGDRDKLGRGWVWEGQIASCIHQNHVFRARLSGGVEPKLVSIWGNTFGRGWFEDRGKQTTNLASLNLKTLKAFPVPIAPVEEQSRILAEVERQMSFLDACERAVDIGLARAAGLRRSVLKAAFEGRLVPQDPSDEPVSVLLDRIRAERSVQPADKRRARQTA